MTGNESQEAGPSSRIAGQAKPAGIHKTQSMPNMRHPVPTKAAAKKKFRHGPKGARKTVDIHAPVVDLKAYLKEISAHPTFEHDESSDEERPACCTCNTYGCTSYWKWLWKDTRDKCEFCWKPRRNTQLRGYEVGTSTFNADDQKNIDFTSPLHLQLYSHKLHNALRWMWAPMYYVGLIPFKIDLSKGEASIKTSRLSPSNIFLSFISLCLWLLFLYFTVFLVFILSSILTIPDLGLKSRRLGYTKVIETDFTHLLRRILKHHGLDLFIFWTTMGQAAFATLHIVYFRRAYAKLIKDWYVALDKSKIQITKELVLFIVQQWVIFGLFLLTVLVMMSLGSNFQPLNRACMLIAAVYMRPFVKDNDLVGTDGKWFFEHYAWLGFFLYFVCMVLSWFTIIIYIILCRMFRNSLFLMNHRIRMVLHPKKEPRIGPNAIRLDPVIIHKDYVELAFIGMRGGYVMGHVIMSFYLGTVLCLLFEIQAIVSYSEANPLSYKFINGSHIYYPCSSISIKENPRATIFNILGHFALTMLSYIYLGWPATQCFREGKETYQLALTKGLFYGKNQLEKNFIRSIWLVTEDKFPIAVTSQGYFKMTRATLASLFISVLTYTIFLQQSRSHFRNSEPLSSKSTANRLKGLNPETDEILDTSVISGGRILLTNCSEYAKVAISNCNRVRQYLKGFPGKPVCTS